MNAARTIEKLCSGHPVQDFDCGRGELDRYLSRYALQSQQAGAGQTYIGLVEGAIVGFYTLAVGHVVREEAPERWAKGLARRPIPIMLLARLAVDRRWHAQRVGKALLRHAVERTLHASQIAGIRAIAGHAKHDDARAFYQRFDFIPSPADPMHLFVLLKDIRRVFLGI